LPACETAFARRATWVLINGCDHCLRADRTWAPARSFCEAYTRTRPEGAADELRWPERDLAAAVEDDEVAALHYPAAIRGGLSRNSPPGVIRFEFVGCNSTAANAGGKSWARGGRGAAIGRAQGYS